MPMTRAPVILKRSDWTQHDNRWHGHFQGKDIGTNITVLFYATEEIGKGPRLHIHPHDEIFMIRAGGALFTIGGETIEAEAGQILLHPAGLPHKLVNLGPGLFETTSIHLGDTWIHTNLDEPQYIDVTLPEDRTHAKAFTPTECRAYFKSCGYANQPGTAPMHVQTQRFIVRDFLPSDWPDFYEYQNDARYRRLYDFAEDSDRVRELFALFVVWKNEEPRENFQGGIFDRRTGRLCGCAGMRQKGLPAKTAILGIELTPDDWGRYKLALEVAVGLINYGFEELGLEMVIGDTSSGNTRIEKMARWFGAKIINQREGPEWMKKRGWKEVDWAISKESWDLVKARRLLGA